MLRATLHDQGPLQGTGMGLAAADDSRGERGAITVNRWSVKARRLKYCCISRRRAVETFASRTTIGPHTATVLIVDDDDELRRFMRRISSATATESLWQTRGSRLESLTTSSDVRSARK